MNRTLKRPMFRIGGSAGTGITSGLTMPRASYSDGTRKDKIKKIVTEDQAIIDELAPSRQSPLAPGTLSSFLIGTGLNLASATPRGKGLTGLVSTAAESAKGPFAQFQKGVFARDASDDQLKKSLVSRAITKVDEEDEPEKFATTKKVLNVDTGKEVFATEKQIQLEESTKFPGQMKYQVAVDASTARPMKVYDLKDKKTTFVNPNQVTTATYVEGDKDVLRYAPIPDKKTLRTAYVKRDGEFGLNPEYVDQDLILKNPDDYKPVEGNIAMMLKVEDIKSDKKIKTDTKAAMMAAADVGAIIRRIEKDIIQKGAYTGNAGETVAFVTGISGFVDQFVNRKNAEDPTLYKLGMKDVEEAIARLENDNTINARLTRFLKAGETQAAKTDIINLAYAVARAREPGGRFSVADIELALRSLGEGSNKVAFLKGLKRSGLNATERAIRDYKFVFNVATDDIPVKYKELLDNYNYFSGFKVETDSDDPSSLGLDKGGK